MKGIDLIFLTNMSHRERLLLGVIIIISLVTFLWVGIYEPLTDQRASLEQKILSKRGELMEISAIADRYVEVKTVIDLINQRISSGKTNKSLLASMELLAKNSGLSSNVVSMSPTQTMQFDGYKEYGVELRLEKVSLPALVSLLQEIKKTTGYARVKRMSVKTNYENPAFLKVALRVSNYKRITK
ncbi:MAG TPA: type II secretion system protein GspM [Nitrospinota bacterium]|nr:type II secretion system protein GspM [Nitrospinota bacterium]|tara:strand:+ start:181033 stop:181587 length:555 start_codon:yes stop_codon:yes gene_type:complete